MTSRPGDQQNPKQRSRSGHQKDASEDFAEAEERRGMGSEAKCQMTPINHRMSMLDLHVYPFTGRG